jgi:hypothetical protein
MFAQIEEATGLITATNSKAVDPANLPQGVIQKEISRDLLKAERGVVDGLSHKYNFDTQQFEKLPPPPPDLSIQIFEALKKGGFIKDDDIHPDTKLMIDRIKDEQNKA